MATEVVKQPFPLFTDRNGEELENGYIYIGTAGADPESSPITVYWDSALTITAVQPLRTVAGLISNGGKPARIWVSSDYSIKIKDRHGSVIRTSLSGNNAIVGSIAAVDVSYQSTTVDSELDRNKLTNLAALKAIVHTTLTDGDSARTLGYTSANDGGSGDYYWNASSTATADDFIYIAATSNGANPGRWVLDTTNGANIIQAGCVGNDSTDNATALQAAITAAATLGIGLRIPKGIFQYTVTPTIPEGLNLMSGDGNDSILKPVGCDGMEFTNQTTYSGSRLFENFLISGSSASSFSGILGQMTSASGDRVTGIHFRSISIIGFGYAASLQGFWNCTFDTIFAYACHQGFHLSNRNIKVTLRDCHIIAGTSPGGAGSRYGVNMVLDAGVRSESVHIRGCYIYGWDIGAAAGNALYVVIDDCDFDNIQTTGVQFVTINGGGTISNCWINTNNSTATTGVLLSALGAAIADGVKIIGNTITATQSNASSIGIDVGNNHTAVNANENRVSGFPTGIKTNTPNAELRDNTINASTNAVTIDSSASTNNRIGPNYIEAGTALAFTSGSAQPAGLMYWATGSFTMALTGCAAGVNASVVWVSSGSSVALSIASDATGTSNATTMTGTGAPQSIRPASNQSFQSVIVDNGTGAFGRAIMAASSGTVTFSADLDGAAFTATGTKGLRQQTVTYSRG